MNTEKTDTDECLNCNNEVVIYKGWVTIEHDRIISVNADWRCPNCGQTGKVDIGGRG